MTEPRCERTDLLESQCDHCREHDNMRIERPKARSGTGERLLGHWFQAAYRGRCSRCETPFRAFDTIRADWPEGSGFIAKECCPRARAREAA